MSATTIRTPRSINKAEIARDIFANAMSLPQMPRRKELVAQIMTNCQLSAAGASTYLQNCKRQAGLI